MGFEHRDGTCVTCRGRIHRYPHPQRDHPDVWAHVNRADWLHSPHDPVPQLDADCVCGGTLVAHPTLDDRWAHLNKADTDGEHTPSPAAASNENQDRTTDLTV